ncbi:ATP-binding protein [Streptomyces virginiae]|uniref:ATP-binding protein n=1 Tax=Streptomyces virginiae TaxID=1961 RepID=UPI002256B305|nr:ATP-binding protein [Streptomyces virginiae]MCX5274610.1 ATP-binding protein [Streptomyces virginiae]
MATPQPRGWLTSFRTELTEMTASTRLMIPGQLLRQQRVERPWLTERLEDFMLGDGRFLVITGLPGTGKTSSLVDFILDSEDRGAAVFTHFCSRRYVDASVDPYVFVNRLLHQLSMFDPREVGHQRRFGDVTATASAHTNRGLVAGTYIENYEYRSTDLRDSLVRGFIDPLREIARGRPVLIAIDGLDELDIDSSPNILGLLINTLASAPPGVKFVVTVASSHPSTEDMRAAFPMAQIADLSSPSVAEEVDQDMARYAISRGLDETNASVISTYSRGNYAHAVNLADSILNGREISPHAFPLDLSERYAQILRRSFTLCGESLPSVRQVLSLVACAGQPLLLTTVTKILDVSVDDLRGRLAPLAEIFVVHASSITFSHPCLRDLIFSAEDPSSVKSLGLPLNESDAHKAVITYYADTSNWDSYAAACLGGHYVWLLKHTNDSGNVVGLLQCLLQTQRLWGNESDSPQLVVRSVFGALVDAKDGRACLAVFRFVVRYADTLPSGLLSQTARIIGEFFPREAQLEFRRALKLESVAIDLAILDAAAHGDDELASNVYLWVLRHGSTAQVVVAPIALGAVWSVRKAHESMTVLRDLAARVSWRRPRQSKRLLSFIADVCILAYANAPTDQRLMSGISHLWEAIFRDRLILRGVVKLLANAKWLWGIFGSRLARQVFEALDSAAGPGTWEDAGTLFATTGLRIEDCVEMLDVSSLNDGIPEVVHRLTESQNAIHNLLGAQILAVHSIAGHLGAKAYKDLVEQASPRGIQWILGASAVVWEDSPVWTEAWAWDLVSRLRIVEQGEFVVRVGSPWGEFTPVLLGWALAAAREDVDEDSIAERLNGCDARVRTGLLDALTVCAVYRPAYCSSLLIALRRRGAIAGVEFQRCISLAVLCHWNRFPAFPLLESDDYKLLGNSAAIDALYQGMVLIGHFNNGVSEGVNYPVMRRGMLQPIYRFALSGTHRKVAVTKYTQQICRMLIDADFRMLNWVE